MSYKNIKQITVISGKGGTGKSSIIAALAAYLKNEAILADADVDAADLYLIFEPEESEEFDFYGLRKAEVNKELCIECGTCRENCRFEAISSKLEVIPTRCEGCATCYHLCPTSAIEMLDNISGKYFVSDTRIGKMIHAKLHPGEESSGLLVAQVRKTAKKAAETEKKDLVLIDGSPGIGCPVISSLVGVDMALVVTEPTLSGYHDLDRVLQLLEQFKIPGYIIVNRFDINIEITQKIEKEFAKTFPVISKIPYNPIFVQAMLEKKSVLEVDQEETEIINIKDQLIDIGNFIIEKMDLEKQI